MTEVQGEQQQLSREEEQRNLLDGMDEDSRTEDAPVGKLNFSEPKKLEIKTKINPVLASMLKRQSATASSVHPQPQGGPEHGHIQLDKAERQELASSSSRSLLQSQQSDDMTKKHVATVFSLVFIPVMLTFYRAYYGNDGPTRFSFHPMMMGVSLFSMLTAMLCQRLGGGQNITLVGSLSFASMLSLLVGVYAVWSTKELYGKPHFLTMHSHFGGMTIFGILCYGLAAYWVFNPWKGVARKNEKIQSYLITTGKIVAGVALTTMSAGIFEIERTWTFLVLWMASLLLVIPFLILS